jgi:uncharacterized protein
MAAQTKPYMRPQALILQQRLDEPRRFIQVVAGPRQVGKTTLVGDTLAMMSLPSHSASADEPFLRDVTWIAQQWEIARQIATSSTGAVLVLDEIQKIPNWSEVVKRLWDADTKTKLPLKVVLLGSAQLLIARGLGESLAGRFELIHLRHWSYAEMRTAFNWSLDQFIFFGGYPGSAGLIADGTRWARYVLDSLIETTLSRDVLLLTRVDKPALLRRLFELACTYSGQILSFTKMLGQLQDAGNATTLAHYLDLLAAAGMVTGLQRYTGDQARSRGSIPKLQVLNTALLSAISGMTLGEARGNPEVWGRYVESAIGAHLANSAAAGECDLYYWRERDNEVDFVLRGRRRLVAVEVKSGRAPVAHAGTAAFARKYKTHRMLLVGGDGIGVGDFLGLPVTEWMT